MSRTRRSHISCPHCGGRATISKRNNLSPTASDLYCACLDTEGCGATFVYAMAYKHTISQPARTTGQLAIAVLNGLPPEERRILLQGIVV